MMNRIQQLPDILSNQIAAGEVVERPASVVKELVENAIDAEATVIDILVEEAGLKSIDIIDNGNGIAPEDVTLAFSRHATSKIKTKDDLFRIASLGFRGEALPSIASVSELDLTTSTGTVGTHVLLQGGVETLHESSSARKGTYVKVSNLFYNTPARLKYIKSLPTELGHITDVINRLSLAHPNISFRLVHDGKSVLRTAGNGNLKQVLSQIYGLAIAQKAKPIKLSTNDFNIQGYLVLPEISRASRQYISTIINGRYIRNFALVKAIQEGFHTLLPIGRYPIVVLQIEMDPLIVDVNVHPSKLEVRLSKEKELGQVIAQGIKDVFKKERLIPDGPESKQQTQVAPVNDQARFNFDSLISSARSYDSDTNTSSDSVQEAVEPLPDGPAIVDDLDSVIEQTVMYDNDTPDYNQTPVVEETDEGRQRQPRMAKLYPIGQMHATYILAQNEEGLFIIDQHAAQERMKYDYFKIKIGEVENSAQSLLIPLVLEFSMDEALRLTEKLERLTAIGIEIEAFGQGSFVVRSYPTWFPNENVDQIIRDIVQDVLEHPNVDVAKFREKTAIMMSCKKSIKANHYLNSEDMQRLLDDLRYADDPFTCPHGRPVVIKYSVYEMEKMFKRVM
ncbi:DNA mismatch repair protein MutL [Brachybacterium faecium]|nr:DNA mismatch repair protein MutL [Brachybacterium faecium]